jgi:hypothetical protein
VTFSDNSYLELISFYEHENVTHRWWKYRDSGGGLIDHALGVDDLAAEVNSADQRGVRYSGPHDGARKRPDGVELIWKTAAPATESPLGLPFLIEDVTERSLRVPAGDAAQHANGVSGIHTLIIAVADIDASATQYGQLLNQTGMEVAGSAESVAAHDFDVHGHRIELQQPRDGSPMAEQVAARGDGPYAVFFRGPERADIDPRHASGARIQIVAE